MQEYKIKGFYLRGYIGCRGKRIISILCVLTLCLGMTFQVEATGLQEKREQLSDLEKEKAAAEQEKENLSQELG